MEIDWPKCLSEFQNVVADKIEIDYERRKWHLYIQCWNDSKLRFALTIPSSRVFSSSFYNYNKEKKNKIAFAFSAHTLSFSS